MTETRRNSAARARLMCCASSALLLGAFLGSWLRGVLQKSKPLRRLPRGLCCAVVLIRYSFRGATEKPPGVAAGGRCAYALMVAAWVAMLATVAGVNVIVAAVVLQQRERKTFVTFQPAVFNSAVKWVDSGIYL